MAEINDNNRHILAEHERLQREYNDLNEKAEASRLEKNKDKFYQFEKELNAKNNELLEFETKYKEIIAANPKNRSR